MYLELYQILYTTTTLISGLRTLQSEIMLDPSVVSPVTGGNETLFDENVGGVFTSDVILHCDI